MQLGSSSSSSATREPSRFGDSWRFPPFCSDVPDPPAALEEEEAAAASEFTMYEFLLLRSVEL
jgi:hypothetical protein